MVDGTRTEQAGNQTKNSSWDTARQALNVLFRPESIAELSEAQLIAIRIAPNAPDSALGNTAITIPLDWAPAGRLQNLCNRSIDLNRALPRGIAPDGVVARAVLLSLRRIMLALWTVPYVSSRNALTLPKPNTWVRWCQQLIRMANFMLSRHTPRDGQIFAHASLDDLAEIMKAVSGAGTASQSVFAHLTQFRHRGILTDWPDITALERSQSQEDKGKERNRKGQEVPQTVMDTARQWQPLPDPFVTELGWRSKWVIENLGPSLLDCFEACLMVSGGEKALRNRRRKIIAEWNWHTPDGKKIEHLPFSMSINGYSVEAWPPRDFRTLQQAVYVLQGVNLFVGSLAMAGRASDVLSLRDGALSAMAAATDGSSEAPKIDIEEVADADGNDQARIYGRTYKLVERIGGAERDWPIPPIVAKAITLQKRLARMLRPVEADYLWVQIKDTSNGAGKGSRLNDPTDLFSTLVRAFCLQDVLGDGENFHHHRCRKTVARLAGLAIVGAPKILMDLFGHKSIEMALSYILSDPDFAAEVRAVAKAQIIFMGKQAIESADNNGGPSAPGIQKAVEHDKALRGEVEYGAKDIYHLAEVLTLNGQSFQLVRPGVVCTKGAGEVGPCSRGKARIDTSSCKERCDHRLELASLRNDVDRAIAECIRHLERALAEDDEMNAECWRGQLLHHLPRFPDLQEKWMANPTVAGLMMNAKEDAA